MADPRSNSQFEKEPALLNQLMEDYLANGGSRADHIKLLGVWILLGVEYMARTTGRGRTAEYVRGVERFVRTAKPAGGWKP